MKRFLLLALTAGLLSPIAAKAEPIPEISDLNRIDFEKPQRIDFKCPTKTTKVWNDGIKEDKVIKLYPKCWVEFNNDHMNIMNKQKINRGSVIRTWNTYDNVDYGYGLVTKKLGFFFLYDLEGEGKIFNIEKRFNIDRNTHYKEIKKIHSIINTWMAQ